MLKKEGIKKQLPRIVLCIALYLLTLVIATSGAKEEPAATKATAREVTEPTPSAVD